MNLKNRRVRVPTTNVRNKLDRVPVVNREKFLVEAARGKVVLNLGCAEAPYYQLGTLHSRLASVAKEIVGVDMDQDGVKFLREEKGFTNIFLGNVEQLPDMRINGKFNLIVAGELLEHLPNPGVCLVALRSLLTDDGTVIVTVPNAFCVKSFFRVVTGCEIVHSDHVSYFSVVTMKKLLEKCGFAMISHAYYTWRPASRIRRFVDYLILEAVRHYAPYLSEGLIVTARPMKTPRQKGSAT